jgi:predicted TIM-barrel fold metal-dependent hydrolase
MTTTQEIIAIEEHFMDHDLAQHLTHAANPTSPIGERLYDFLDVRIREMDAAGIDVQVLSHQSPGTQRLGADVAVEATHAVNNALAAAIESAPDRFSGFAMLPTINPDASADELTRAVEELGLKGALMHGLSHGRFVDEPDFWPIFARAEKLGVPIYLHPALPDKSVIQTYYGDYAKSHPALIRSAWGFGVETGTQAVRMILSGIFDKHPDLRIVLGHLGEAIPFLLTRIDESFSRADNAPTNFAETFRNNFHITTSGFFSDSALRCCIEEMGIDRIMFAIDWPYVTNTDGVNWINKFEMDATDKAKLLSGNARKLLKL